MILGSENGRNGSGEWRIIFGFENIECITSHRPQRLYLNGNLSYITATGLERVPGLIRPLCPHAGNPFRDRSSCEMYVHSHTVHGRQQWVFQSEHKCSYIGEFRSPVNLFQYLNYSHQVHIPKSLSCSKYVLKEAGKLLPYQMLSTCLFTLCIQDWEDWEWNYHSSFEADGM